jgi:hypothetical protein
MSTAAPLVGFVLLWTSAVSRGCVPLPGRAVLSGACDLNPSGSFHAIYERVREEGGQFLSAGFNIHCGESRHRSVAGRS